MCLLIVIFCLFTCFQLRIGARVETEGPFKPHGMCKPITVPICQGLPYNQTIFPNIIGHQNQEDAGLEVHQYFPLVKMGCSSDLKFFLCSVFIPVCTILEHPIPPCRPLCLSVKGGCEGIMKQFRHEWPENLNCDKFPEKSESDHLCVSEDNKSQAASTTNKEIIASKTSSPKQKLPFYGRDIGFVCPQQFKVPEILEYSFKVGKKLEKNCGAPCHLMFFENRRQFSRNWIGAWAILCTLSCLFTVCTFLIDTNRFRYPERPIIFLSVCYMLVAVAYVIGFLAGDGISCREPYPNKHGIITESTITQGTKYELCTIIFMLLYFFSMASSIWWVVLTLTWFLAAGLKWGHEAIEANSQYFHLAAWALPAIKTISILAMGKVDGM